MLMVMGVGRRAWTPTSTRRTSTSATPASTALSQHWWHNCDLGIKNIRLVSADTDLSIFSTLCNFLLSPIFC